jgi:hypothetical protein
MSDSETLVEGDKCTHDPAVFCLFPSLGWDPKEKKLSGPAVFFTINIYNSYMEELPQIEDIESKKSLPNVEYKFWSDDQINYFFDQRLKELENPQEFIDKNKWQFINFKRRYFDKGYSDQELVNIFISRERDVSVKIREKIFNLKRKLESDIENILNLVYKKINFFLVGSL